MRNNGRACTTEVVVFPITPVHATRAYFAENRIRVRVLSLSGWGAARSERLSLGSNLSSRGYLLANHSNGLPFVI